MKKKVGIAIAVIIILVGLAMMVKPKQTAQVENSNTNSGAQSKATTTTVPSSLKDLLGLGTSKKCSYIAGEGMGMGTVYVTNGKMRSDAEVKTGNTTTVTHMIVDGQTSYTWMDGQDTGYKMDFAAMAGNSTKGDVGNSGHYAADVNKNMNFTCENWSADPAKFTLPGNVTFSDMSTMMQGMPNVPTGTTGTMTGGAQDMEAMCANLQEPAKSQCLAAMKKK